MTYLAQFRKHLVNGCPVNGYFWLVFLTDPGFFIADPDAVRIRIEWNARMAGDYRVIGGTLTDAGRDWLMQLKTEPESIRCFQIWSDDGRRYRFQVKEIWGEADRTDNFAARHAARASTNHVLDNVSFQELTSAAEALS